MFIFSTIVPLDTCMYRSKIVTHLLDFCGLHLLKLDLWEAN